MAITKGKVAFLASHRKGNYFKDPFRALTLSILVQILDTIKSGMSEVEVVTFGRDKETGRSAKQFEGLFQLFKEAAGSDEPLRIGILGKDKHEGPMVEEWASYLSSRASEFESVDASLGVSICLSVKDSDESVSCLSMLNYFLTISLEINCYGC